MWTNELVEGKYQASNRPQQRKGIGIDIIIIIMKQENSHFPKEEKARG